MKIRGFDNITFTRAKTRILKCEGGLFYPSDGNKGYYVVDFFASDYSSKDDLGYVFYNKFGSRVEDRLCRSFDIIKMCSDENKVGFDNIYLCEYQDCGLIIITDNDEICGLYGVSYDIVQNEIEQNDNTILIPLEDDLTQSEKTLLIVKSDYSSIIVDKRLRLSDYRSV